MGMLTVTFIGFHRGLGLSWLGFGVESGFSGLPYSHVPNLTGAKWTVKGVGEIRHIYLSTHKPQDIHIQGRGAWGNRGI